MPSLRAQTTCSPRPPPEPLKLGLEKMGLGHLEHENELSPRSAATLLASDEAEEALLVASDPEAVTKKRRPDSQQRLGKFLLFCAVLLLMIVIALVGYFWTLKTSRAVVGKPKSTTGHALPTTGRPPLAFPPSGKLKVVIFTDLHFGEPLRQKKLEHQDVRTARVMNTVLDAETPDFVVFTGDLIAGEHYPASETQFVRNGTKLLDKLFEPLVSRGIPWASTYGNHDHANRDDNPRFALALLEQERRFNLSYTQRGPLELPTPTNYLLPIFAHEGDGTLGRPMAFFWFLDSGSTELSREHINWLRVTWDSLVEQDRSALHLLFVHIPTKEVVELQNSKLFAADDNGRPAPCFGLTGEADPKYQAEDHDLFRIVGELGFATVYSGHDHGTTWCCVDPETDVQLCMGRHTGHGGYGQQWGRGARVIELDEKLIEAARQGATARKLGAGARLRAETWIRMEDGSKQ